MARFRDSSQKSPSCNSQAESRPVTQPQRFSLRSPLRYLFRRQPRRPDDIESVSSHNQSESNTHSTALTPTNTTSTAATSVSSGPPTSSVQPTWTADVYPLGNIYVDPLQDIDKPLAKRWEKTNQRLGPDMMRQHCGPFSASLCFVSDSMDKQPVKTLLVTCENDEKKRKAEQYCRSLGYLQDFTTENDIPLRFVVVPRSRPLAYGESRSADGRGAFTLCSLKLPQGYNSLCGLPLSIERPNGSTSKTCCIGGLVVADAKIYGWTTRHSFEAHELNGQSVPSWRRSARQMSALLFRQTSRNKQLQLRPLFDDGSHDQAYKPHMDYVLLELADTSLVNIRQFVVANQVDGRVLRGSLAVEDRVGNKVKISTFQAGTFHGTLNGVSQLVVSGSSVHRAYLIVLDRIVPSGCSGAWVVQDDYVLGFLVAGRDDLPWAYMVSMEDALHDIGDKLQHPVRVASKEDIDKFLCQQLWRSQSYSSTSTESDWSVGKPKIDRYRYTRGTTTGRVITDPPNTLTQMISSSIVLGGVAAHRSICQLSETTATLDGALSKEGCSVDDTPVSSWTLRSRTGNGEDQSLCHIHSYNNPRSTVVPLKRVRCRVVVELMGGSHSSIHDLTFTYLQNKSSYQEISQTACNLAITNLLLQDSNLEVYLSSLTCGLIEVTPSRVFDLQIIENEQQWSITISTMLHSFYSQHMDRDFILELRFTCGSYPKIVETSKGPRSVLRSQLQSQMREGLSNKGYIPRLALTAIMSSSLASTLVLIMFKNRATPIALECILRYFRQRAPRLLAACLIADVPDAVIHKLYDLNLDDTDLPLSTSSIYENSLRGPFLRLLSQQWKCICGEFDGDGRRGRPWILSVTKDEPIPQEMRLPFSDISHIGSGSFGKVFKVKIHKEHHNLTPYKDVLFAFKVIEFPLEISCDTVRVGLQALKDVAAEVKSLHIVYHAAFWVQGNAFHILSPLASHNLQAFVDTVPQPSLTKDSTLWALRQMRGLSNAIRILHNFGPRSFTTTKRHRQSDENTSTVAYCHHFDLKPENILVFPQQDESLPIFKIADFGTSKIGHLRTANALSLADGGHLHYSAPELAADVCHPAASRASDIWSLGAVLSILVTWISPHVVSLKDRIERSKDGNAVNLWHRDAAERFCYRPEMSEYLGELRQWASARGVFVECIELIEKMLNIEPSLRPTAPTVVNEMDVILQQAQLDLRDEDFYLREDRLEHESSLCLSLDESPFSSLDADDDAASSLASELESDCWSKPTQELQSSFSAPSTIEDLATASIPPFMSLSDEESKSAYFTMTSDTISVRTASNHTCQTPSLTSSSTATGHDLYGIGGFIGTHGLDPRPSRLSESLSDKRDTD